MSVGIDTPGIDVPRVSDWLSDAVPGLRPPFTFELIAGGRSNMTYRVADAAGTQAALRRPPLGPILPSAHDMAREHRLISALWSTPVPVPEPLALCEDEAVSGSPFYAMSFADGAVLRDEAAVEARFAEDERAGLAHRLVDVLADLHAVDPVAVGLGDLARHDGYFERQLRRWLRQAEATLTEPVPALVEVPRRLSVAPPAQQRTSLVHGDYRLDNVVFDARGRIQAVLDWELCTLGDPLADVGWLLATWVLEGEDASFMLSGTPTALPGFPTRDALLERYAARSGLDVSTIAAYEAFSLWKLACIAEGIRARDAAGARGAGHAPDPRLADQVVLLADRALSRLGR